MTSTTPTQILNFKRTCSFHTYPLSRENQILLHANSKATNQPRYPRIATRDLEGTCIVAKHAASKILASLCSCVGWFKSFKNGHPVSILKRAIIGSSAKRHSNGVSLTGRYGPEMVCWLGERH